MRFVPKNYDMATYMLVLLHNISSFNNIKTVYNCLPNCIHVSIYQSYRSISLHQVLLL